jgi:SHS2 domain-containing protein
MSYTYFDHEADVGIVAYGSTLEEAFQIGAQAMLDVICEQQKIGEQKVLINLAAHDLVDLWISFLNELLAQMDIQEIFLSHCVIRKIKKNDEEYRLEGTAYGFPRSKDMIRKSEVKAATYCQAEVIQKPGECKVQCVLDL